MSVQPLHEDLLAHLVDEFGETGQRAVDYLSSAQILLAGDVILPSAGSHVAYALRSALLALLAAPDAPRGGQWRSASRAVTEAKSTYERAAGLPGEDAAEALKAMFDRIDDMARTHEEDALHQQRLIAVMLQRTGVVPMSAGLQPVKKFDHLMNKLNRGVHQGATLGQARQLWNDGVAILEQLFLPPRARHAELDQLALVPAPQAGDIKRALALLTTPLHVHYFLSRAQSPAWLHALSTREMLDPPTSPGVWPVFAAVETLKSSYPEEVLAVLVGLAERWSSDAERSWYVALGARDLGSFGRDLILKTAQRHPSSSAIMAIAIDAASASDPADGFVADVADVALNSAAPGAHAPYVEELLDALVIGITSNNYDTRLQLLCRKLRHVPADDLGRRMLAYDRASIAATVDGRYDEAFTSLLGALTRSLTRAFEHASVRHMLTILDELPGDLRSRVRAWVLGVAPDVSPELLATELTQGLATREPTGDDVRLVERLTEQGLAEQYIDQWKATLGPAPDPGAVARGLAEGNVDQGWQRARQWSAVLPRAAWAQWSAPLAVLAGEFGPVSAAMFGRKPRTGAAWGRSPIDLDTLRCLPVSDAAAVVAQWRPEGADWLVSARELGRTLEEAVVADPAGWGAMPVENAAALRHPTYIAHYLRGLARSGALPDIDLAGAMDVIELVDAHPWDVVPLGADNDFDYDRNWTEAERAGVALIQATAEAELSLGSKTDQAWRVVLAACECDGESSVELAESEPDRAALERAINRPCTQALDALIVLMGQRFRENATVPPEALAVLDRVLGLPGQDGAEHRAILAPRITFLRYIAPEWTGQRLEVLYGDRAPAGLAEVSLLLTLRRSRPTRWFLEQFADGITSAARSGNDHALEHSLVGMLWAVSGFEPERLVARLAAGGRLSVAGEKVGRLLRQGEPEPDYVECGRHFWELSLETGSDDLLGFGWMAEVVGLGDQAWLKLTLRTLQRTGGRIDWSQVVVKRAVAAGPSGLSLDVLNAMVRGMSDPWDRRAVGEQALLALRDAEPLRDTPGYRRLDTTLRERGFLS
jgi:hypothetical protein